MKNIFILLFILLTFSAQAAPDPSCSLKGTRGIYTNGIVTSFVKALEAMQAIDSLGINAKVDSSKVRYRLAYNYQESFAKDILESAVQRLPQNLYILLLN